MFHVYSVDPSPLFYQSVREVRVLFINGEPVQRVHPPHHLYSPSVHFITGRDSGRRGSFNREALVYSAVCEQFRFWGKTIKGIGSLHYLLRISLYSFIIVYTYIYWYQLLTVKPRAVGTLFRCRLYEPSRVSGRSYTASQAPTIVFLCFTFYVYSQCIALV